MKLLLTEDEAEEPGLFHWKDQRSRSKKILAGSASKAEVNEGRETGNHIKRFQRAGLLNAAE